MLTELVALGLLLFMFTVGFLVGKTHNGVAITINTKQAEQKQEVVEKAPQKFNESTSEMLPDEVRIYLDKTNGFIE